MSDKMEDFFDNLKSKKIIEVKFGKQINENCFYNEIDENLIKQIFEKFKKYNVKYFNNKVYCYNNLQLIVYNNGTKKCYKDINLEKIDIISDLDMRLISKCREKIDEILFPSYKNYDMVFNRELLSISLKDNLKINIYNKYKGDINNYELSVQYLYNPKKKDNIQNVINEISAIKHEIQEILTK